ncbi:hypothetical protein LCGC14_1506380 [marine sediment metagenome]|uniref:Uncharacterized protein n=1 Tax=marine sediment metagenome TaxID=412755 RepID=A0A0F9M3Y8_9ZZZZ
MKNKKYIEYGEFRILLSKYSQFPKYELKSMGLIPQFEVETFKE